ncbi:MAG: hypothetical protein IKN63_04465 [Bacilli bacterium]|nr:hypothetical protein [Bacilli bacterium]
MKFETMGYRNLERPQRRTETNEYSDTFRDLLLPDERWDDLTWEEQSERIDAYRDGTIEKLLEKKLEEREKDTSTDDALRQLAELRAEIWSDRPSQTSETSEERLSESQKAMMEIEKKLKQMREKLNGKHNIEKKVVNGEFVEIPDGKMVSIQERKIEQMIRETPSTEPIEQLEDLPTRNNSSKTIVSDVQSMEKNESTQSEPPMDTQQPTKNVNQTAVEFVDLTNMELFSDIEDEELLYEKEEQEGVYSVYKLKDGRLYDAYIPNKFEGINLKEYATKSYKFYDYTDIENFTHDIIKGLEYYYNLREYFRRNCYFDAMNDEKLEQLEGYIEDVGKVMKAKLDLAAKLAPAWYHGRTPAIPQFYYGGGNPNNMHGVDHKYDYLLTEEEKERFPLMRDMQFSLATSTKPIKFNEAEIIQIQHGKIIDKKREEFLAEYHKSTEDNIDNNDYFEPISKLDESTKESEDLEKKKEEKEIYMTMQELVIQNKKLKEENEQLRAMLAKYQQMENNPNVSLK